MKSSNIFSAKYVLAASPVLLAGVLLIPSQAIADTVIACNASGGTNCPSPVDSIDDLNPPLVSTITVPQGSCVAGSVTDINVNLDINHSWVGDLLVQLSSPSNVSTNVLLDQPGTPPGTLGCSRNDIQATFDDASATPAEGMCLVTTPTITGIVSPFSPLSVYNGGNADGVWTLTITDQSLLDTGNLNDWSLDIKCTAPTPQNVPVFSLWGLFGLMGLLGFAGRFIKRRKR